MIGMDCPLSDVQNYTHLEEVGTVQISPFTCCFVCSWTPLEITTCIVREQLCPVYHLIAITMFSFIPATSIFRITQGQTRPPLANVSVSEPEHPLFLEDINNQRYEDVSQLHTMITSVYRALNHQPESCPGPYFHQRLQTYHLHHSFCRR